MYLWSPWWRHQMETFSALLVLCAGNSPVTGEFPAQRPVLTGEFPAQRPVTRSYDVFFDLRPNKRLSKQSWADDLRRHRAHYDPRTGVAGRNSGVNGPNSNCFTTYDPHNHGHSVHGATRLCTRGVETLTHTIGEFTDIITFQVQTLRPRSPQISPLEHSWEPKSHQRSANEVHGASGNLFL